MRKNPLSPLFTVLALTLISAGALSAQTPQTPPAQPPKQTPAPKPQPPVPGAPYKPDFEIPKPEGPGGQPPATDPSTPGVPSEGYVIGSQDQLNIIVSDESELLFNYPANT